MNEHNQGMGNLRRLEWLYLIYSAPGIASHANSHLILIFDDYESDNETL